MRAVVGVAFSGGLDSTALLHATAAAARAEGGLDVAALHVHHGLLAEADAWVEQATELCARWRRRGLPVALHTARVGGKPARGASVEAWAREARYAALAGLARQAGCDVVLLAQHRRDQAETFLLQALRGAGPRGLAAMARESVRDGVTFARPWLELPREHIEAYARRHRLTGVTDPSNDDPRYARSRLRHDVMPALRAAFPDAEASLAAAARLAADARAVLDERVAEDQASVVRADGQLSVVAWASLPPARGRQVLLAWLTEALERSPPRSLVERLSAELTGTHASRWPAPDGTLIRHRRHLRFEGLSVLHSEGASLEPAQSEGASLHLARGGEGGG